MESAGKASSTNNLDNALTLTDVAGNGVSVAGVSVGGSGAGTVVGVGEAGKTGIGVGATAVGDGLTCGRRETGVSVGGSGAGTVIGVEEGGPVGVGVGEAGPTGVGTGATTVGDGLTCGRRETGVFDKSPPLTKGSAGTLPTQPAATTSIKTMDQRFFMWRIITLHRHAEVV